MNIDEKIAMATLTGSILCIIAAIQSPEIEKLGIGIATLSAGISLIFQIIGKSE